MDILIPAMINWTTASATERAAALQRPAPVTGNVAKTVRDIINRVREQGDDALYQLGKQYDQVTVQELEVSAVEWALAEGAVPPTVLQAMDDAIACIDLFHRAGKPAPVNMETMPGVRCEARYLPISSVGLYVPSGTAPLISSVIMLAVPARIAGCEQVILCTPPNQDGRVPAAILVAAVRCGIKRVFKVGGAQAIAAMGLGTASIPACAKLFGPGNAWVTEAKQQISTLPGGAARDLPAGPSEVLGIADSSADATAVCWDLLAQAEHGPDSQSILISDSADLLAQVQSQLPEMAAELPRAGILAESLQNLRQILAGSIAEAVNISNQYAPEHLLLNCDNADDLIDQVEAAGSVFIGPWTPESLGDYCSGTNHVLPTYGYARAYGGLSVSDFLRRMTIQSADINGLRTAGPVAATLAEAEGLDAHRMAVEYRLAKTGKG